jgi:hypothetical protein
MKKIKILLFLALLTSGVAVNAQNRSHQQHYTRPQQTHNNKHNNNHNGGGCNVATPLDGGLLSVLGVGGIVYFLARKKRNNKEL